MTHLVCSGAGPGHAAGVRCACQRVAWTYDVDSELTALTPGPTLSLDRPVHPPRSTCLVLALRYRRRPLRPAHVHDSLSTYPPPLLDPDSVQLVRPTRECPSTRVGGRRDWRHCAWHVAGSEGCIGGGEGRARDERGECEEGEGDDWQDGQEVSAIGTSHARTGIGLMMAWLCVQDVPAESHHGSDDCSPRRDDVRLRSCSLPVEPD